MHILELPQPIRDELYTRAVAPMQVRALLTTYAKTLLRRDPDGTPHYSAGYTSVTWDISDRISTRRGVGIEYSKPYLPLDGGENIIKAGRVTLDLINTDEALALEQNGAIIASQSLEQSRVSLVLNVNGAYFPIYRGKVYGRPGERRGLTSIEIRDELWAVAKAPVTFERFHASQQTAFLGGSLTSTPAVVGGVEYYDGITVWGQDATYRTSVVNENQEDVAIFQIVTKNGAKLGRYVIEFLSGGNFRVVYPDNQIFQGSVAANFTSDYVDIPQAGWQIPNAQNLDGKKIEFFVYKTFSGNPIDCILNELEKAFTEAYGVAPTRGISLPIDYATFADVRQRFANYTVYVSETNKNNDVWLNMAGKRPLNVLQLCQRIADHICCQIVIDNYGMISIKSPAVTGQTIYTLSDTDAILSHEVVATQVANQYRFQYGFYDPTGSSSSHIFYDERQNAAEERAVRVMNLPYFKQGVSDAEAQSTADTYMERILKGFTLITCKVKPNYAATIRPGDVFRIVTNTQPRLNGYFEVYDTNVDIGQPGVLKLVKVPEPTGDPSRFCRARYCKDEYC